MASLHGLVGLGGRNWRPDVVVVQRLLAGAGVLPGPVDGRCGRHTMQAIERFQTPFLHRPDGRVDVAGPTWRHLEKVGAAGAVHAAHPAHSAPVHHPAAIAHPTAMTPPKISRTPARQTIAAAPPPPNTAAAYCDEQRAR